MIDGSNETGIAKMYPITVRIYDVNFNRVVTICLMFFRSAIALLTNFNRFLQREDPLIYLMYTQMETFLNKVAVKFRRPEKVMEHKEKFGTLKGLDISLENQKADAAVTIGMVTKGRLRKFLDEGDIDICDVDQFYDGVRRLCFH